MFLLIFFVILAKYRKHKLLLLKIYSPSADILCGRPPRAAHNLDWIENCYTDFFHPVECLYQFWLLHVFFFFFAFGVDMG